MCLCVQTHINPYVWKKEGKRERVCVCVCANTFHVIYACDVLNIVSRSLVMCGVVSADLFTPDCF